MAVGADRGEVAVSLATRSFPEAGHRAAPLDGTFRPARDRLMADGTADQATLAAALWDEFRRLLETDTARRLQRQPGHPVYADWWDHSDSAEISAQAA